MPTRVVIVAGAAILVAVAAIYALSPPEGLPAGAQTEAEMADALGSQIMEHLRRGHVAGRAGEVMTVPKPHHFLINNLDLTTLGSETPELRSSHPNPWDYTARVPFVFYGPGIVPEGLEVRREVDISALAPTYAKLLGMSDFEADGRALEEIGERGPRPRAIFTVILDGGGWNVLQQHPQSWPTIASLMADGTSYVNATIGSAPSVTGALHATFGTGFYPLGHKIPGNQMRGPDGANTDAWQLNADPSYLEKPTVSELWDERTNNRAVVGALAYEGWHLGMVGHGAQREGADHDIAVLWEAEDAEGDPSNRWWINKDFFKLPPYLEEPDLATLEFYESRLDERDGVADGLWFGNTLEEVQEARIRPGSPAFVRFSGDAVVDIMRREDIGLDPVTDLFWVELKMPDYAGHAWNMLAPEEGDVLAEADRQLARFRAVLDQRVGRGRYVLAVSADHGQEPLPETFGGWRIAIEELERDVEERFGDGIVEKITTVDFFMDMDAVEREGVDLSDVAGYLSTYTIEDNIATDQPGAELVPEGRLDDRLFAGAFSTKFLQSLSAEDIASYGASDYPEGDLTVGVEEP